MTTTNLAAVTVSGNSPGATFVLANTSSPGKLMNVESTPMIDVKGLPKL
jgi:hypothetical protein